MQIRNRKSVKGKFYTADLCPEFHAAESPRFLLPKLHKLRKEHGLEQNDYKHSKCKGKKTCQSWKESEIKVQ